VSCIVLVLTKGLGGSGSPIRVLGSSGFPLLLRVRKEGISGQILAVADGAVNPEPHNVDWMDNYSKTRHFSKL
jgi:hypothetical protein